MIDSQDKRNPVDALGEEYLDRRRNGEAVTVEEYCARHPDLADEIERLFPMMAMMETFKDNQLSSSGSRLDLQVEVREQLGDYRIIREIGRGGMGVVYEAEQQSLSRPVALKVFPKVALRDSKQLERFRRESRTAASLHHTNIVPVFGVGEQDGLHYYVMQRIEGIPLDQVIEDSSLSHGSFESTSSGKSGSRSRPEIRDVVDAAAVRLSGGMEVISENDANDAASKTEQSRQQTPSIEVEYRGIASIGIQVSDALSYAHLNGVLHRDIKPANLILDPNGVVWVTDFGLATVLQAAELDEQDVVGTLRFMAPERFSGKQDGRSDVYSLGLTLYELLTLQPAIEKTSRADTVRRILAGEITPPRSISPQIPRDLEAIVLKAISVDPGQRYECPEALADDLRRFTEGRPVQARRTTPLKRTWSWIRRNPLVASLSTALLLLAVTSFVLVSAKWQEAVVENKRAEENLSLALESMDQLLERHASSWMAHPLTSRATGLPGGSAQLELQVAASERGASLQWDGLKFYDRFAEQNPTNPRLQHNTARVHRRVADIYGRLGQYQKAEVAYRRSIELLDAMDTNDDLQLSLEQASAINQLGLALHETSRFDQSESEFRRAMKILSQPPFCEDQRFKVELARTKSNLGQSLWLSNQHAGAQSCHDEAVTLLESVVADSPDEAEYRLALAHVYRIYHRFTGSNRESATSSPSRSEARSSAVTILEQLVQDFPAVPDYRCELAEMLVTGTEKPIARAVELSRVLVTAFPTIPRYRAVLARSLNAFAKTQRNSNTDQATDDLSESIAIYKALASEFTGIPVYRILLAMALRDQAQHLRQNGDSLQANAAIDEGILHLREYIKLRPENPFAKGVLRGLERDQAAQPAPTSSDRVD